MKIGKECQKKKGKSAVFWDKFLVIPILKIKYMSCLPNVTLSNDGNVPGIMYQVPSCMISTKN